MSDSQDVHSILNNVVSRSIVRRQAAVEEVIRLQSEEKIARTVRQLVSEAQASLRATLAEELAKIASDTKKQLEVVHQPTNTEDDFIPELLHVGVDILKEYRILQDKSVDMERGEHNLSTTLESDNKGRGAADVAELMQHSMSLLSGAEEEITQPIIDPPVDTAGTSKGFDAYPESDDDKGWMRDGDDDDDDDDLYEIIPRGGACLPRHVAQTGDLSSVHTVRSTPRNSQRSSNRRTMLESDEEERQGDRPSSVASNPTRIRRRSESPGLTKKATKSKEHMDPFRHRFLNPRPRASQPAHVRRKSDTASQQSPTRRRQPIRKSTIVPHTYNVKKIFTNRVGSLDGPEYWAVKSDK
ncbi:hypothetical protein GQX73_g3450 [Xylaria multiplex]|uniref:Uncharacterized protein n=1 Tax=Xylaria multiplex TaxID=323545 RepID=A0A7C8MWF8_9PEZI|nr:hypothetical protein GQX73_g3450 [Xylaria multiplex]